MGSFSADEDPHPGRPSGQVDQAGDLGDGPAVPQASVGVDRRSPRPGGDLGDRGPDGVVTTNPTE